MKTVLVLITCAGLVLSGPVSAQNAPRIALVPWATGLDSITDITFSHAGDPRLFVTDRHGEITIISDSMTVVERPFLDIGGLVLTAGHEQGLLGMAFDPDYTNNGFFYLNYISGTDAGTSIISRWQVSADPDSADVASEQVIYSWPQPYANHNGGDLLFGPDGYLYIPFGDGGDEGDPENHAQDLSDPFGDIVRLDVSDPDTTYTIPPTNPWISATDTLPEIWASGLRNPFRASFDRLNGDLWIGDVGQSAWEEVDHLTAGDNSGPNFGWHCYEGPAEYNTAGCEAQSEYVQPVTWHVNDGLFHEWSAIVAGYVYRGNQWPHLLGHFIYTDFRKPEFWSLYPDGNGGFVDQMLLEDTTKIFWTTFGENADGELFVGNRNQGEVFKIVDACPMDAPSLSFDGFTLTSSPSDSAYAWFLDGVEIPGANAASYAPTADGEYQVQAIFQGGCVLRSDTVSVIITGVAEAAESGLSLQPNPANEAVTITMQHLRATVTLRLVNAQGRVVYQERDQGAVPITLDLDDLAAGPYAVQLLSRLGEVRAARPLLVVH